MSTVNVQYAVYNCFLILDYPTGIKIERVLLKKPNLYNKAFEFIVGHDTVFDNVTVHGFRIVWSDRCAISHRVSKANTFFRIKTQ